MKGTIFKRILAFTLCCMLLLQYAYAETTSLDINNKYQSKERFDMSSKNIVKRFDSTSDGLGNLVISAEKLSPIEDEKEEVYVVKNGLSVQFSYNDIKTLAKEPDVQKWAIIDDGATKINDYDLKTRVGKGAILVQKSYDNENWENCYVKSDILKEQKKKISNFYSASRNDLLQGCHYKILIMYKIEKIVKRSNVLLIFDNSPRETRWNVEEYRVFLISNGGVVDDDNNLPSDQTINVKGDQSIGVDGSLAFGDQSTSNILSGQEIFTSTGNQNGAHGFAAEGANILNEKITSIGNTVTHTGESNILNGPDYTIQTPSGEITWVQTKYYEKAADTFRAFFDDNGLYKYWQEEGVPQQMEVPKEQYDAVVALVKEKILNNKFPGISDPDEAYNIVRRGSVTYKQAKNITKAANIKDVRGGSLTDSLIYDAKTGAITAIPVMGISAVISFAYGCWNGDDIETSLRNSLKDALKAGGVTVARQVLSGYLQRVGLTSLLVPSSEAFAKAIGYKASSVIANAARIGLKPIYGAAAMKSAARILRSNTVTGTAMFVIFAVPDVVRAFNGKISVKQLIKNSATSLGTIGGGFAGAAAGAALGSVIPGAGTAVGTVLGFVGGVAGGIGGGAGVKALADLISEDDAVEMQRILEMEFKNLSEEYLLNHDESEELVNLLEKKLDENELRLMYQASDHHQYARNMIEKICLSIVKKRPQIVLPSDEEVQETMISILEEIYDEVGDIDE